MNEINCNIIVIKLRFYSISIMIRASERSENLGIHPVIQGLLKEQVLLLYLANLGERVLAPPVSLALSTATSCSLLFLVLHTIKWRAEDQSTIQF